MARALRGQQLAEDKCAHCDIPNKDYDPSDPDCFTCSDCACGRCEYVHCCEEQCYKEEKPWLIETSR